MTLEHLEKERASIPDALDLPRTLSQREVNEHIERARILDHQIRAVRYAQAVLDEVTPEVATLTKQQADLAEIREELCVELFAAPPRSRNREELNLLQGLKLSIRAVDGYVALEQQMIPEPLPLFTKLRERGYRGPAHAEWNVLAGLFGHAATIEGRLKDLAARRRDALRIIDSVLHEETVVSS